MSVFKLPKQPNVSLDALMKATRPLAVKAYAKAESVSQTKVRDLSQEKPSVSLIGKKRFSDAC